MDTIVCSCRAKINLTLEVLGKRPDGFHEITSVMQALDLHDTLEIRQSDDLSFTCSIPELSGEDNLVLKAARLLRETAGITKGADLHLIKRIPSPAGLGGGSSDAAAALRGLNQLWGSPLSFDALMPLAGQIGSDVPFFLFDGTALAEGRGEKVNPLPPMPPLWVVLVRPDVLIAGKTGVLYGMLSAVDYSSGHATTTLASLLRQGKPPDPSLFCNVFEKVALQRFAEIHYWHNQMLRFGAERVWLAGSGPTLFSVMRDEGAATKLGNLVESHGGRSFVTRMAVRQNGRQ